MPTIHTDQQHTYVYIYSGMVPPVQWVRFSPDHSLLRLIIYSYSSYCYSIAQRQLDTCGCLTCMRLQSDTRVKWIFVRVIQNCTSQKLMVMGMPFTSALYKQHYTLVLLGMLQHLHLVKH